MSSGFTGEADFYAGGGSGTINHGQVRYRSQLGGILVEPSPATILPRRTDLVAKRSTAELERQQQQILGGGVFSRSVKQRSYSPISPLSPVDFSSPDVSAVAATTLTGRYGIPLLQSLRPQWINPNNQNRIPSCNPSVSGFSFSQIVPKNPAVVLDSEPESEKKMRNRLQELAKQLLDDNDEDGEDAASVVTGSEWSETVQSLLIPNQKPISPSPTSSSSSSTSSSPSSYSSCSLQSLLDAAAVISEGKMDAAMATLARLKQVSDVRGDPEQRLTAFMVSALCSRVNPIENPAPATELAGDEHMIATQMLYEASPCFKLGFMATNLAILEATRDQPNKVHVVNFDIGHGSQYSSLIRSLAGRKSGEPIIIKITTVIEPGYNYNDDRLRLVGDWLIQLAKQVGVSLKFNAVSRKIADLNRDTLGCDADEALAVNFAFRLYKVPDESVSTENPRDQLLRLVKDLAPRVVTLVEQEMNANTAPFVARVAEVCAYYRALLDSLDPTLSRDALMRKRVEECLARKATNSVACEGRDRVERCEVFGKWRARMRMAGLEPSHLGQNVVESIRSTLNELNSSYKNNSGFTVKEEDGGIHFGWKGRVLTVASAWR